MTTNRSEKIDNRLQTEIIDLRRECDQLRRRECELGQRFQTKFDSARRKWQLEKRKSVECLTISLKSDYQQRLTLLEQIKDKDIKMLHKQLANCQHHHSVAVVSSSTDCSGAENVTKLGNKNRVDSSEMFPLLKQLRSKAAELEKMVLDKEEEICKLKKQRNTEAQQISTNSRRHINVLLEEIRKKDKQISKMENDLKHFVRESCGGPSTSNDCKENVDSMNSFVQLMESYENDIKTWSDGTSQTESENVDNNQLLMEELEKLKVENLKLQRKNAELEMLLQEKNTNDVKEFKTLFSENGVANNFKKQPKSFPHKHKKRSNQQKVDVNYCNQDYSINCSALDTIFEDCEESDEFSFAECEQNEENRTLLLKDLDNLVENDDVLNVQKTNLEWIQEKLKYVTLIDNFQTKIDDLENVRQQLETELREARDENENLEFKLLESENYTHHQRFPTTANEENANLTICNRLVCTSDDEGCFSVDGSDLSGEENFENMPTLESIKTNFILLKNIKELTCEQKNLITCAKSVWENLEKQLTKYKVKESEMQIQVREKETEWQNNFDNLRINYENVLAALYQDQTIWTKIKTDQHHQISELQNNVASLKKELESTKQNCSSLDLIVNNQSELIDKFIQDNDRLKKMNFEYQESLSGYRKIEEKLSRKLMDTERKYEDVKQKFRDSLKIIRDYESDDAKYAEKIKCLTKRNQQLTEELEKLANLIVELKENANVWEQKCFKLEHKLGKLKSEFQYNNTNNTQTVQHVTELMLSNRNPVHQQSPSSSNVVDQSASFHQLQVDNNDLLLNRLHKDYANTKNHLAQIKTYCWHLETQFDIQIKIAKILKDQITALLLQRNDNDLTCDSKSRDSDNNVMETIDNTNNRINLNTVKHLLNSLPHSVETSIDWVNFVGKIDDLFVSSVETNENVEYCALRNLLKNLIDKIDNGESIRVVENRSDQSTFSKFTGHHHIDNSNDRHRRQIIFDEIRSILIDFYNKAQISTANVLQNTLRSVCSINEPEIESTGYNFQNWTNNYHESFIHSKMEYDQFNADANGFIYPPCVVRMESNKKHGHYVIAWDPPVVLSGICGYKIYINGKVAKVISNPFCLQTFVEFQNGIELKSVAVASVGNDFHSESSLVSISVMTDNDNDDKRETENTDYEDYEECTEV